MFSMFSKTFNTFLIKFIFTLTFSVSQELTQMSFLTLHCTRFAEKLDIERKLVLILQFQNSDGSWNVPFYVLEYFIGINFLSDDAKDRFLKNPQLWSTLWIITTLDIFYRDSQIATKSNTKASAWFETLKLSLFEKQVYIQIATRDILPDPLEVFIDDRASGSSGSSGSSGINRNDIHDFNG